MVKNRLSILNNKMDIKKLAHLPRLDVLSGARLVLHEGKSRRTLPDGRKIFFDHSSYIHLVEGLLVRPVTRVIEVAELGLRENSTYLQYKNETRGAEYGRGYFEGEKEGLVYTFGLSDVDGVFLLAYEEEAPRGKGIPRTIKFTPLFQIKTYTSYGARRKPNN